MCIACRSEAMESWFNAGCSGGSSPPKVIDATDWGIEVTVDGNNVEPGDGVDVGIGGPCRGSVADP